MPTTVEEGVPGSTRRLPPRLAIWETMLLIAGLAVGLWLFKFAANRNDPGELDYWMTLIILSVGGLAAVGPVLLVIEARRRKTRWGAGRILWFSEGAAAWLLWPPVIRTAWLTRPGDDPRSEALCYYYGTPLMAIYMMSALWLGGRGLRRRKRRVWQTLDWKERFGWFLSGVWACTGLYLLARIYWTEFRR